MAAGCAGYLSRPIETSRLGDIVRGFIEASHSPSAK
jgi:hypothetical protein